MDKEIEDLRKIYLKQELPGYLKNHGLADLRYKLEERKRPSALPAFRRFSIAFMALLVLVFAFLVNATENSRPGSGFYPVKKFSEGVFGKIDNTNLNVKIASPSSTISSPSATPKLKPNSTPKPSPKVDEQVNFSQFLLRSEPDNTQVKGDSIHLPFQTEPVQINSQSNDQSSDHSNHNNNGQSSQIKGAKKD